MSLVGVTLQIFKTLFFIETDLKCLAIISWSIKLTFAFFSTFCIFSLLTPTYQPVFFKRTTRLHVNTILSLTLSTGVTKNWSWICFKECSLAEAVKTQWQISNFLVFGRSNYANFQIAFENWNGLIKLFKVLRQVATMKQTQCPWALTFGTS